MEKSPWVPASGLQGFGQVRKTVEHVWRTRAISVIFLDMDVEGLSRAFAQMI
jgi:hypothetical protein